MKALFATALVLALSACASPSPPPATLYERVAASLADRPDLESLGKPPAEMQKVAWMIGDWTIDVRVFATPTTPESQDHGLASVSRVVGGTWLQMADVYPEGTQDLGFMTYNIVTRRWVSLGLDSAGNSVLSTAPDWQGNQLKLIAEGVEILGEKVTLRQTVTQISPDEFMVLNEERLEDGSWVSLDEYRYRRRALAQTH